MEPLDAPRLGPPFDEALREALDYVDDLPEEILGIWLAGSVAAGRGDANSDLDLYVLVGGSHRRRLQRIFDGVPTEIFLNPPERARRYFAEDRALGRTPSLSMMADGLILYDPHGHCATISAEAREAIAAGPDVSEEQIAVGRYLAVDKLDNARDVAERDPATATFLAARAIHEALILWFHLRGEFAPRDKDLLPEVREANPHAAAAVDRFAASGDLDAVAEALRALIGVDGFYEWETAPDDS